MFQDISNFNSVGVVVLFDNHSANLTKLLGVFLNVSSLLNILGMVVIGASGTVASGTSTNGAVHKIPGLVCLVYKKLFFPSRFLSQNGLAYFWGLP